MTGLMPSTNGVVPAHDAVGEALPMCLRGETCIQYVLRLKPGADAQHWRSVFTYCHVPCDAPADDWIDPLQRVMTSEAHLIHKEPV